MIDDHDARSADRLRRYWDNQARCYDREMAFIDRRVLRDGRAWVCSQASGDVLEVAAGTGRNLRYYPAEVRVTGVELSPQMLARARSRANELGREAELQVGDAQALDFPDASFDTVVCTLAMCAIPDMERAIREMWRVLRPGGKLLLLDHVVAESWPLRAVQWLIERVSIPRSSEHMRRRPLLAVQAAGFTIERQQRYGWGMVERLAARKPA